MGELIRRQGRSRFGPGHGFDDGAGHAEDFRVEDFVVRAPADAEVGGLGPGFSGLGVGWGARGYGGAGAVGEEERVGLDVGNELVEAGGGVGERAGGE